MSAKEILLTNGHEYEKKHKNVTRNAHCAKLYFMFIYWHIAKQTHNKQHG